MSDLTGLGKLADSVVKLAESELAIRSYDDLLAAAMEEGGQVLADTFTDENERLLLREPYKEVGGTNSGKWW